MLKFSCKHNRRCKVRTCSFYKTAAQEGIDRMSRRPTANNTIIERRRAMSDAFFNKLFGDSEPTRIGSGWVSGVLSVFLGLLGMGGALCLHFPALLTLPDARSHYPVVIIRLLIQGTIAA